MKTGEEQEPAAHLWLWAVFPGPEPVSHQLPVPLITQASLNSKGPWLQSCPWSVPGPLTMPEDPSSLWLCQPLAPDTVSQHRGSWVNISHHSCLAEVGPSCHSRNPEEGEVESLGRWVSQRIAQCKTCTQKNGPAPARPGSPFLQVDVCGWTPSPWNGRCPVAQVTDLSGFVAPWYSSP